MKDRNLDLPTCRALLVQLNQTLCDWLPELGAHRSDGMPADIHDQILDAAANDNDVGAEQVVDPRLLQLTITHLRALEEQLSAAGMRSRHRHKRSRGMN